MTGPKIITLDVETAPHVVYSWGLFKQNIGLDQIIRNGTILSYSAKTLGEKEVRYEDVSDQDDYYNDHELMRKLWAELDDADIVVTQNGINFDIRKINARFIQIGLPPPSPYRVIDTKVEAKKLAMFTSNKLEWLADALTHTKKRAHTKFPGFKLWAECLKGNPAAWAEMRKYNPQDVVATEEVYLRLRPYIVNHPNVAAYDDDETRRCPACGHDKLHQKGYRRTNAGLYPRYRCVKCSHWSHGRYTVNTKAKRQSLLAN